MEQDISVSDRGVVRLAVSAYPETVRATWSMALVTAITGEALFSVMPTEPSDLESAIKFGVGLMASFLLYAVFETLMTRRAMIQAFAMEVRISQVGPAIALAALMTAFLTLGLIALVVPVFIMGIRWWVAMPVLYAEGLATRAALKRSRALMKGKWKSIVPVILLVCAMSWLAIPALYGVDSMDPLGHTISIAVNTLTIPLWVATMVASYVHLRRYEDVNGSLSPKPVS